MWFSGLSYKLRILEWNYPDNITDTSDSLLNTIKDRLGLERQVSKDRPVGTIIEEYTTPEDIPAPQDAEPFEYGITRIKELYDIS